MKKIKIFALPSHGTIERTSGVDFARIIQPMEFLSKHKDFEVHVFDPKEKADWRDICKKYDVIYFNYLANDWGFAAMGCEARANGVKLIMDLDDDLWDILPDNPAYQTYQPSGKAIKNFTAICNEVDYVTTTSMYLKHVICNNTRKHPTAVKVFPNYIDLDLYSHRSTFKDDNEIVLLHFGSTTHFLDLAENEFMKGIDKIMSDFPNVKFKTVGAMLPDYKNRWGQRYENDFGDPDIYKWIKEKFPKFMDEADIIVVPLKKSIYTKAKSSIKFLEASSAKKPGVWQNIRQYDEVIDGNNGFLAESADDWYQAIKILIEQKDLRKKMGQRAFDTIEKDWQQGDKVEDYADFFKKIFDTPEAR